MTASGGVAASLAVVVVLAAAGAAALLVPTGHARARPAEEVVRTTVGRDLPVLRLAASLGVLGGTLTLVGGVAGTLACLPAAVGCWWWTGRLEPPAARRRRERLRAAVPLAVDLMAACLTAGLSPTTALAQVAAAVDGPLREELAALDARLRLGAEPLAVWRDTARHPQLSGLGRTLARAVETGSPVAEAMQRLAEDSRREERGRAEARARAVGVKAAVPLGLCLLPAFVLVGVVPLVAGSLSVLFGS